MAAEEHTALCFAWSFWSMPGPGARGSQEVFPFAPWSAGQPPSCGSRVWGIGLNAVKDRAQAELQGSRGAHPCCSLRLSTFWAPC